MFITRGVVRRGGRQGSRDHVAGTGAHVAQPRFHPAPALRAHEETETV